MLSVCVVACLPNAYAYASVLRMRTAALPARDTSVASNEEESSVELQAFCGPQYSPVKFLHDA